MKVLIIANIRCGGSNLMRKLASYYNSPAIFEPRVLGSYGNSVVVKVNAGQHSVESLCEFSTNFDRIILLDRMNKQLQIQSAIHMFHTSESLTKWKWSNDLENSLFSIRAKVEVEAHTAALKEIGEKLNIPITYYEDLYYGETVIEGFTPDTSKKLRQDDKKKTIL